MILWRVFLKASMLNGEVAVSLTVFIARFIWIASKENMFPSQAEKSSGGPPKSPKVPRGWSQEKTDGGLAFVNEHTNEKVWFETCIR